MKNGPGPNYSDIDIAMPSETLLFFSAGAKLSGLMRVTVSGGNKVKFSVRTSINEGHSQGRNTADTIVCTLKRQDGEYGVGLFNPIKAEPLDSQVSYDVIVELPISHPYINRFETNVVNSDQLLGFLEPPIFIGNLSMHGSDGSVTSWSSSARWVNIQTSNGAIEGNFNSSDDFVIATSNGRIEVNVDFHQVKSTQAKMSMTTTNNVLAAFIELHDMRDAQTSESDSDFLITTRTSNDGHLVEIQKAPVDSILTFRGSTSNSPMDVLLPPTFEGHFTLDSRSNSSSTIVREKQVDDPAGRGRRRHMSYRNAEGRVEGDVEWGGGDKGRKGEVEVSTSNSWIRLNL